MHEGAFVICAEPIAAGRIGRAYTSGICQAYIEVSDEAFRFADIQDDSSGALVAAASGSAEILWKQEGVGSTWALVRLGAPAAAVRWAVVGDGWRNQPGNGSYADCRRCDNAAGDNPEPSAPSIRVYLPRSPGRDPNVVQGQVIGYMHAADGSRVAVTGHLDDAIGTIKMWASDTLDPPPGWTECTPGGTPGRHGKNINGTYGPAVPGLHGRFPVGRDADDEDFHTVNAGGAGSREHCHPLTVDLGNEPCTPAQIYSGTWDTQTIGVTPVNHLPPWCVVRFIERYDNSL